MAGELIVSSIFETDQREAVKIERGEDGTVMSVTVQSFKPNTPPRTMNIGEWGSIHDILLVQSQPGAKGTLRTLYSFVSSNDTEDKAYGTQDLAGSSSDFRLSLTSQRKIGRMVGFAPIRTSPTILNKLRLEEYGDHCALYKNGEKKDGKVHVFPLGTRFVSVSKTHALLYCPAGRYIFLYNVQADNIDRFQNSDNQQFYKLPFTPQETLMNTTSVMFVSEPLENGRRCVTHLGFGIERPSSTPLPVTVVVGLEGDEPYVSRYNPEDTLVPGIPEDAPTIILCHPANSMANFNSLTLGMYSQTSQKLMVVSLATSPNEPITWTKPTILNVNSEPLLAVLSSPIRVIERESPGNESIGGAIRRPTDVSRTHLLDREAQTTDEVEIRPQVTQSSEAAPPGNVESTSSSKKPQPLPSPVQVSATSENDTQTKIKAAIEQALKNVSFNPSPCILSMLQRALSPHYFFSPPGSFSGDLTAGQIEDLASSAFQRQFHQSVEPSLAKLTGEVAKIVDTALNKLV